jgi:hypothetical protein
LEAKKESTSGQCGFAHTLSTDSEQRRAVSPTPQSPLSNDPDEVEQCKFDSLAVTVTNSSRSHTNEGLLEILQQFYPQNVQGDSIQSPIGTPTPPELQRKPVPSSIRKSSSDSPDQREQGSYKTIQRLFSRASHLISESSELHGIIFVDASLQDIAVTDDRRKSTFTPANTPRFGGLAGPSISFTSGFSMGTESTNLDEYIRQGFKAQVATAAGGGKALMCQLLGYSLQTNSGQNDAAPSNRHLNLPQSTLRGLLRRYPNGHVFLFNSDGSLLDEDDMNSVSRGRPAHRSQSPSKDKSKFEKEKEQLRAYQLLHICPGARGIIFIPLWDPQRDQVRTVLKPFFLSVPLTSNWSITC